jgi:hypothetical protein
VLAAIAAINVANARDFMTLPLQFWSIWPKSEVYERIFIAYNLKSYIFQSLVTDERIRPSELDQSLPTRLASEGILCCKLFES